MKQFPEEMRINDILKVLKRCEWLITDDEKRFKKNIWIQDAPRKMVAVHKEYLIQFDSVEGGILI